VRYLTKLMPAPTTERTAPMTYDPIEHDDEPPMTQDEGDFSQGFVWGVVGASLLWIAIGLIGVWLWTSVGR